MAAVQALAVGEEHAAKVRAVLEALAEIASAGPSAPVEEVTMRYLVKVMQRPGVTRVTTVLWHWRVLSTFWPTLRRSSRIMAFVTGLMILSPVAPERAGRTVERSCDLARVMRACDVLLRVPARINLLVVQAAVNLLAGGRLRETIRAMTRGGNAFGAREVVFCAEKPLQQGLGLRLCRRRTAGTSSFPRRLIQLLLTRVIPLRP
jgi:hypothetical protein